MFDTYQGKTYSLRPSTACCRVLVLICSSNVRGNIVSGQCRNSSSVPCLQDGHHGNTSHQGCRSCSPPRHICFSITKTFPYPRRNGFSTDRLMLPIVTQKRGHKWSIWLGPKWFSMSQISLQIKTGQRLTLVWDSIQIRGGRWPRQSVLPPDRGMKIAAWHWRKRVLIINT